MSLFEDIFYIFNYTLSIILWTSKHWAQQVVVTPPPPPPPPPPQEKGIILILQAWVREILKRG